MTDDRRQGGIGHSERMSDEMAGYMSGAFLSAAKDSSGTDRKVGSKVTVKVTAWNGIKPFTGKDGATKDSGSYEVEAEGSDVTWRINKTNAGVLHESYEVNDFKELIGKTVVLQVQSTSLGNGFVISDVK